MLPKVATPKQIEELKKKYDSIATMAAAFVNEELKKANGDFIHTMVVLKGAILTGISIGKFEDEIDKLEKEKNGKS